jgi:hypothetical protein
VASFSSFADAPFGLPVASPVALVFFGAGRTVDDVLAGVEVQREAAGDPFDHVLGLAEDHSRFVLQLHLGDLRGAAVGDFEVNRPGRDVDLVRRAAGVGQGHRDVLRARLLGARATGRDRYRGEGEESACERPA